MNALNECLFSYDAFKTHPVLNAPIYLLEGVFDQIQSPRLAEEYLSQLEAPHKELVWFDHSAHMPQWEEPDRFHREVRRIAVDAGLASSCRQSEAKVPS